jgi:hypothetical protein
MIYDVKRFGKSFHVILKPGKLFKDVKSVEVSIKEYKPLIEETDSNKDPVVTEQLEPVNEEIDLIQTAIERGVTSV